MKLNSFTNGEMLKFLYQKQFSSGSASFVLEKLHAELVYLTASSKFALQLNISLPVV